MIALKKLIISFILLSVMSCTKTNDNCDCQNNFDFNILYVADDLVSHNGVCWIAIRQGKGVEPGPWLQNSNDVWEECK